MTDNDGGRTQKAGLEVERQVRQRRETERAWKVKTDGGAALERVTGQTDKRRKSMEVDMKWWNKAKRGDQKKPEEKHQWKVSDRAQDNINDGES